MSNPFSTPEMAEGYASARPPLHARIVQRAIGLLQLHPPVRAALDLGCGSGLSTRPLLDLARFVCGAEPNHLMAALAATTVPQARFFTARAEALPLPSNSIDLITAAGSLNYTRLAEALAEAARVLTPGGALCVYDFSQGRRFQSSPALAAWFAEFERLYPMPAGEALQLNPEILSSASPHLQAVASDSLEIPLPMSAGQYAAYIMTEANVAAAIRGGARRASILEWAKSTLGAVFNGDSVLFSAYVVCLKPRSSY